MKSIGRHILFIALVSAGILVLVIGFQAVWYHVHFPRLPEDAPETISLPARIYLSPLGVLSPQSRSSSGTPILAIFVTALIWGSSVYLLAALFVRWIKAGCRSGK